MTLTSELQSQASKDFPLVTPAFVYVFTHNGIQGIRVEAPEIMKEYTDGVLLGRDPRGLLYFHTLRPDFNEEKSINYSVTFPSRGEGVNKEIAIVIDFLRPTTTQPFATFIATLPQRAHKDATPFEGGGGSESHWTTLDVAQITAQASLSKEVELNMQTLKKKFTFTVPDDVEGGHHLNEWGYLLVKDVGQLEVGPTYFVDYTNTRILIFKEQNDENPVAVFGCYELEDDSQSFDVSFQACDGQFSDI